MNYFVLLLNKILEVLDPFEVSLSRLERSGRDILICRITKDDNALSENEKDMIIKNIKLLNQSG